MILSSSLMAQETQSVIDNTSKGISTVYNDVKSTAPKIEKALSTLGKELKVGANAVWDVLVKQQLVWSWCFLILTLSAIGNWLYWYKLNIIKLDDKDSYLTTERIQKKVQNPKYDRYSSNTDIMINGDLIEREIRLPNRSSLVKGYSYLHLTICIALSLLSFYHFSDMMTGFINPEYGAMKTIAEIATQIK